LSAFLATRKRSGRYELFNSETSFLGSPIEIYLVTNDFKRTIVGLSHLGIGPWYAYTLNPENTTSQTYLGKSSTFNIRVCFADLSPTMVYEVIEPLSGPSIFQEFLDQHGEGSVFPVRPRWARLRQGSSSKRIAGIHHIAYDCNNIPFEYEAFYLEHSSV